MRQPSVQHSRSRRRRRCYRWSAAEKAHYLKAFRRSGDEVSAFCEAMDLSPVTFAQWQRDARHTAVMRRRLRGTPRPAFARVEVVAAATSASDVTLTSERAIRLVVRGAAGHEAALDGVDAATALHLVALVLARPR